MVTTARIPICIRTMELLRNKVNARRNRRKLRCRLIGLGMLTDDLFPKFELIQMFLFEIS